MHFIGVGMSKSAKDPSPPREFTSSYFLCYSNRLIENHTVCTLQAWGSVGRCKGGVKVPLILKSDIFLLTF